MKQNKISLSWFLRVSTVLLLFSFIASGLHAEQYPDPLLTTPATAEVITEGLEADGYALGVMAYTWGYPLVRMEQVMREYTTVRDPKPATSYRAPLNQVGWARELATPSAKDMPTANNDTMYMSSVVKLDEPYILAVPDTQDRYYVINVFNMWHELEHYTGRRTTGTEAGRYVIVPPDWKGRLPWGMKRLHVTSDKVWLWGRLRVVDGDDMTQLHALQDQVTIVPLSAYKDKNYTPKAASLNPMPEFGDDGLGFMRHLGFALKHNPVNPADAALFAQFERIGLTREGFDPSQLSEPMVKGLVRGLEVGPEVATASMASSSLVSRREGWDMALGLDDFGFNYPLRAMISGPYLGGNGELEAVYPIRYADDEGKPLNGSNNYVVRFEQAPPVGAFWSLTIYNADDKMLVENPINRYKVGGDTPGFVIGRDGTFEIPVQHGKPEGEYAPNWLPAPEGDFYLLLRLYQPDETVISGEYALPQLKRI